MLTAGALALAGPATANAATPTAYPSDPPPDLIAPLSGYSAIWTSDGRNDLHGTVVDAKTLQRDDQLAVWINQHATAAQRFRALQDSEYEPGTGPANTYDQSITDSTALGSILGPAYVQGRQDGSLPLTSALINSSNGTSGAHVSTGAAKAYFSHPRPYLPSDPNAQPVAGDAAGCAPAVANASSQQPIRVGRPWADAQGNLKITRVPDVTDTTHQFSPNDVALSPGYGSTGICLGGSFPSGHTTTAYEAGITLATLLPELAPEILARASEQGNDRIVLGVHYPLDIMGGRIDGEVALTQRWSDPAYRDGVLLPARAELVAYLTQVTGHSIAYDVAHERHYRDNPYGGQALPGGTAQIVRDRFSSVRVYTERETYGFAPTGSTRTAPQVPTGADDLLRTTYPSLTPAQRTAVLARTELPSGFPLDGPGAEAGWQRLDLAAATSATVLVLPRGDIRVLRIGGTATVIRVP